MRKLGLSRHQVLLAGIEKQLGLKEEVPGSQLLKIRRGLRLSIEELAVQIQP